MDKKLKEATAEPDLAPLRQQIDLIDDKLLALLKDRTALVSQIGELKHKALPGQCPIRPGREALMLRRVVKECGSTGFPPAAAAQIWRILIGASTSVEGALKLSVYTPERDESLAWMAREYFGSFNPLIKQSHIKRVIGDVMDNKAAVGVVPLLRGSDTTYWWTNLMQQGNDTPRVFAYIPFVINDAVSRDTGALAIAKIAPEETGDDVSLLVLETEHNTSQHRLQQAFIQARLEATWINIATLSTQTRHHLISVKGFITPEHAGMREIMAGLGASLVQTSFLGAYAAPISIETAKSGPLHVASGS